MKDISTQPNQWDTFRAMVSPTRGLCPRQPRPYRASPKAALCQNGDPTKQLCVNFIFSSSWFGATQFRASWLLPLLLLTKRSNCLLHRMQKVCKNGFLLQPIDPNRKLLRCPRNKLSLRSGNHFFILLVSKLRSTSYLKEPFIDDVIGFFLFLRFLLWYRFVSFDAKLLVEKDVSMDGSLTSNCEFNNFKSYKLPGLSLRVRINVSVILWWVF